MLRGPRLSATCVAITPDESSVYCGSKDGSIVRWDLNTGARLKLPRTQVNYILDIWQKVGVRHLGRGCIFSSFCFLHSGELNFGHMAKVGVRHLGRD